MRLMSKGEYVIVPKGTKFEGAGKLGLISRLWSVKFLEICNFGGESGVLRTEKCWNGDLVNGQGVKSGSLGPHISVPHFSLSSHPSPRIIIGLFIKEGQAHVSVKAEKTLSCGVSLSVSISGAYFFLMSLFSDLSLHSLIFSSLFWLCNN